MQTNSPQTLQVWSVLADVSGSRCAVFSEHWTCLLVHINIPQIMGKSWHFGVHDEVLLGIKTSFRRHVPVHEVMYIGMNHWQVFFYYFFLITWKRSNATGPKHTIFSQILHGNSAWNSSFPLEMKAEGLHGCVMLSFNQKISVAFEAVWRTCFKTQKNSAQKSSQLWAWLLTTRALAKHKPTVSKG